MARQLAGRPTTVTASPSGAPSPPPPGARRPGRSSSSPPPSGSPRPAAQTVHLRRNTAISHCEHRREGGGVHDLGRYPQLHVHAPLLDVQSRRGGGRVGDGGVFLTGWVRDLDAAYRDLRRQRHLVGDGSGKSAAGCPDRTLAVDLALGELHPATSTGRGHLHFAEHRRHRHRLVQRDGAAPEAEPRRTTRPRPPNIADTSFTVPASTRPDPAADHLRRPAWPGVLRTSTPSPGTTW